MASDSLAGLHVKLERAEKHIRDLDVEICRFIDNGMFGGHFIQGPPDPEKRFKGILQSQQVPATVSVITGEVLYQLRSSLDHLICSLLRQESPCSSCARSQFPIFDEPNYPIFKRQIEGINRAEVRGRIEASQPYIAPHGSRSRHLSTLRNLSNADKHRSLILHAMEGERVNIVEVVFGSTTLSASAPERSAEDLAKDVASLRAVGGKVVNVKSGLTVFVAFKEWKIKGYAVPVGDGLRGLLDLVRSVIADFEPFF